MRCSIRASCGALTFLAVGMTTGSPVAAQAKIERIIGPASAVMLLKAGATSETPVTVGMMLQPGDMLRGDTAANVELRCATKGATAYRLAGGFRLFIDVPLDSVCTVNILGGHADVIAEEPTNTTAGTISLASKGTQYSVDVTRVNGVFVCKVVVYEGVVIARNIDRRAIQGTTIQWTGRRVATGEPTAEDIDRSAALYATFDVAAARDSSPQTSTVSFAQFKALHAEVLRHPTDTSKRVELAKRQLQYKVDEQAAYNLKRANVTSDTALERVRIDPARIRSSPTLRNRIYRSAATSVVRPEPEATAATTRSGATRAAATSASSDTATATRARSRPVGRAAATRAGAAATVSGAARAPEAAPPPTPAPPPPQPTDADLQLIASGQGQIDIAIRNLEARVAAGTATSRDHYALAKAYDGRDAIKVREHATLAISMQVTDGKLSNEEIVAIRDLLARAE